MDHNENIPSTLGNEIFERLIDIINLYKGKEQVLAISGRKDQLSQKSPTQLADFIDTVHHNHHEYTEKRAYKKLSYGLNITSIVSLLEIFLRTYGDAHATTGEKDKDALFDQKKEVVQKKIVELYKNGLTHNRMMLGVYMLLNHNDHIDDAQDLLAPFSKGKFKQHINERLFIGEDMLTFWATVEKGIQSNQTTEKTIQSQKDLSHTLS